jgi:two-component system, OmpR family, response regulator
MQEVDMRSARHVNQRILIAEDEQFLREMLSTALRFAGFDVDDAADGEIALTKALTSKAELIVLDVMMPGLDGYEVCRRLRAQGVTTPVIFLTALGGTGDVLSGFERGGDDYLVKPFSLDELIARIRAVLARAERKQPLDPRHQYEDLILDEGTYRVTRGDRVIDLSPTEFRLLRYLIINAGRVVSRPQILAHVWKYDFDGDGSIIENYISALRKKVDATAPKLLHTIRGVGYSLRRNDL